MGNREDLLEAAKKCLQDKGYARTTVRDLATEAKVSMAAIGYHYGSKEALLNEALVDLTARWGRAVAEVMRAGGGRDLASRWTALLGTFPEHRELWSATFEVLGQLDQVPRVRELLIDSLQQGRAGLAQLFEVAVNDRTSVAVGSFYQALLIGVMAQYLIDPEHAPTGADLADALKAVAGNG